MIDGKITLEEYSWILEEGNGAAKQGLKD